MEGMSGWASVTLPGLREREEKARNGPSQIENSLFLNSFLFCIFFLSPIFKSVANFWFYSGVLNQFIDSKKIYIYPWHS
jgi:hypothetical protein